ncbi:MAG: TetR/AcrR family transcriptional regulator [Clostridium sp.]
MKNNKKENILIATKKVISTRGIQNASVREISKAAGVTTGAIYHHYKSKEDILYDVMADSLAKSNEVLENVRLKNIETDKVLNQVIEGIRERFNKEEENKIQFYLAMTGIEDNKGIRDRFKDQYKKWITNIEELLKVAYTREDIKDINALASFLLSAIDGFLLQYMLGANTCTPQEFTSMYEKILFKGIPSIVDNQ